MRNYQEHQRIINREEAMQVEDESEKEGQGLSRRKFIRNAAVSAAGAAFALKGARRTEAQSSESGQVTVDAILLSYVAAPLGSIASTTNTYTKSNATTFRLTSATNQTLSIGANASILGFSVGSTTYRQTNSTQVTDAITLRRSTSESFATPAPGAIANTVFLGLLAPEMQFDGDSSRVLFRFLSADDRFALTHSDLQSSGGGGQIKPNTVNSFLSHYITDQSLLVTPRFKLKSSILLSAGVRNTFSFTKATGSSFSTSKSRTTSVEVTRSFGFNLLIINGSFSVGSRIDVTHTSVQEVSTDRILTSATTLERTSLGINKVYWDRIFKTFVVIDAGAPSPQALVQGVVRDPFSGAPIPDAMVRLLAQRDYVAMSDGNGNYAIHSEPGGEPSPGTYSVICGDDSVNASIGGSPPYVVLEPTSGATDYSLDGEAFLLN